MVKISNHAKETSKISDSQWHDYFRLLYCDDAPKIDAIDDTEFDTDISADILNEDISLSEHLTAETCRSQGQTELVQSFT